MTPSLPCVRLALLSIGAIVLLALGSRAQTRTAFTIEQIFSYPFPSDLTAAAKGSRVAWTFNEQGRRNVWVADGPSFTARKLTAYDKDEGQELTSIALSPAGDRVVYVRGGDHGSNWDDEEPVNATSQPLPPQTGIWSIASAGGEPTSLGEGDTPAVSPRGDRVAFVRDRHIWSVAIDGAQPATRIVAAAGANGNVVWSPDGSRFAFVSNRDTHAFIGVYENERTPIKWIAPSTSRDSSPRWSPDGTRLVFVRRPGAGGAPASLLEPRHNPWALWTADMATATGQPLWTAPRTLRGSWPTTDGNANLHWAVNDRIVFLSYEDGWPHLYSVSARGGAPMLLTPGGFMVEHVSASPDGTYLVASANTGPSADDLNRRHVLRVPVDRAAPEVLTPGTGLEWAPVVTGDLGHVAFIGATAERPPLPMVVPARGGRPIALASDRVPNDLPASLVVPKPVTYKASDGVVVHAQLFEPPDVGAAPRPAIVYVHGGPPRQMLLGWHYSDYYARAYAANQYLAARGFRVLAINYRLGIGYGYEFHVPAGGGARGASEYLDVKAAAEYLRTLPQVDPSRIGIYGGLYGGYSDRARAGAQFRSLPGGRGHSRRTRLHHDGLGRRDGLADRALLRRAERSRPGARGRLEVVARVVDRDMEVTGAAHSCGR